MHHRSVSRITAIRFITFTVSHIHTVTEPLTGADPGRLLR